MTVHIKRLLTDSWPAVTPLPEQLPPALFDEVRTLFGKPGSRFLIAEDQQVPEKVLGCGGICPMSKDICEIRRLVVAPPYQRHGVGQRLLTFLIKEALELGYQRMRVQVPATVEPLQSFYLRFGFREVSPYRPCSPDEFCFYELDLSSIELQAM